MPDYSPKVPFEQVLTSGNYQNEKAAVDRLKTLLTMMGSFNVCQEVTGDYEYMPHYKDFKSPRIDFLLLPTKTFIESGWNLGAIGIECKRSDTKIGKALSQIMDYSRAVFRHPTAKVLIKPDYIFLWPCEKVHGDIASLMAQNRFGSVCESYQDQPYHCINFYCGESRVFKYEFQGKKLDINDKLNIGKRVGSR